MVVEQVAEVELQDEILQVNLGALQCLVEQRGGGDTEVPPVCRTPTVWGSVILV